tara:strand:- start:1532 stop:2950 length:1419 start_codon:yes stop_codon:yes gene_type:complete
MPTTAVEESAANGVWQIDTGYTGARYDHHLLGNEFSLVDDQKNRQSEKLRLMLLHCFNHVPFYQQLFRQLNIAEKGLSDGAILEKITPLTKEVVKHNAEALHARALPQGHRFGGESSSSGTTGEPTVIKHTVASLTLGVWLKQRELRWYRWNPEEKMLSIRPLTELPRRPDGSYMKDGQCIKYRGLPYFNGIFKTGDFFAFNNTNSVALQRELLAKVQPSLLLMQASCLEYLSMGDVDAEVTDRLHSVQAIAQTLTPNMRKVVEASLKTPIHQNYGLNEIGLVASRCSEGGRYHVHSENCIVEIVRPNGEACAPGERGKILVTSLLNFAMPLIRYDTDDIGEAVDGPCVCGRTLPSFSAVHGRYRRIAYMPEGTLNRWGSIQLSLYTLPPKIRSSIKRYQAVQDKNGDFELRIDCNEAYFPAVVMKVQDGFKSAYMETACPELVVFNSHDFKYSGTRKFQNFLSEYTPEMDL